MKALLHRALVALVGSLACLTTLVTAEAGAADALPSTISQIRVHQLARVNQIKAEVFRTPHNYYGVTDDIPILSTNVAVSGLSPEGVTNKLREVCLQLATLAMNFPPTDSSVQSVEFQLVATAREADIPTIFPDDGAPMATLEMMGVNCYFSIVSNGAGGYVLPDTAVAQTIPVYMTPFVFLPFPDLKYFDGPAPPWFIRFKYVRENTARVFVGNLDGSVREELGKRWGSAYIDYTQTPGPSYGTYANTGDAKLLIDYDIGRIGIHLSLITNGTPAVLALEASGGSFSRYWLPTGQLINSPVVTAVQLVGGEPRVSFVGQPGDMVVLESAASFGPNVRWVSVTTFTALSESGITNYTCPTAAGSQGAFFRVRVAKQAAQNRP